MWEGPRLCYTSAAEKEAFVRAYLGIEDGQVFEGRSVGAEGEATGELVFNTAMTGYQEILTDPSYAGQVITMTYPQIGNYGVNEDDLESRKPFLHGFVMRECCFEPSNWRAQKSLPEYLKEHGIVAIDSVDTRQITKALREKGAMKCVISTTDSDPDSLVAKARNAPDMTGSDYVKHVTVDGPYQWNTEGEFHVVALDYGIKYNILRMLANHGCRVTVMPATATAEDVLAQEPDGVFLSNGPGDPAALPYLYDTIRAMTEEKPVFGICLGHQVLGHALGGQTYKLKFGHRGANHPILNHATGAVEIASHNHGFALDPESLDGSIFKISHTNLNDKSVAGIEHMTKPVFGVQYHPEASPGPHDSHYLFKRFIEHMREARTAR